MQEKRIQYSFIYDEVGSCTSEESFELTIIEGCIAPTADVLSDVRECTSYRLPELNTGNNYYTTSGALGTQLFAGDIINIIQ